MTDKHKAKLKAISKNLDDILENDLKQISNELTDGKEKIKFDNIRLGFSRLQVDITKFISQNES